MRRTVVLALVLALAGCFTPTFTKVQPGQQLGRDTVILVGSFTASPAIEQHKVPRDCSGTWVNGRYEPPGKVVFVQETDGNVMAFFTRDLSEPFDSTTHKTPSRYDWMYMPISGHFFVEIPRTRRLSWYVGVAEKPWHKLAVGAKLSHNVVAPRASIGP